jgi:hypothetical protein
VYYTLQQALFKKIEGGKENEKKSNDRFTSIGSGGSSGFANRAGRTAFLL